MEQQLLVRSKAEPVVNRGALNRIQDIRERLACLSNGRNDPGSQREDSIDLHMKIVEERLHRLRIITQAQMHFLEESFGVLKQDLAAEIRRREALGSRCKEEIMACGGQLEAAVQDQHRAKIETFRKLHSLILKRAEMLSRKPKGDAGHQGPAEAAQSLRLRVERTARDVEEASKAREAAFEEAVALCDHRVLQLRKGLADEVRRRRDLAIELRNAVETAFYRMQAVVQAEHLERDRVQQQLMDLLEDGISGLEQAARSVPPLAQVRTQVGDRTEESGGSESRWQWSPPEQPGAYASKTRQDYISAFPLPAAGAQDSNDMDSSGSFAHWTQGDPLGSGSISSATTRSAIPLLSLEVQGYQATSHAEPSGPSPLNPHRSQNQSSSDASSTVSWEVHRQPADGRSASSLGIPRESWDAPNRLASSWPMHGRRDGLKSEQPFRAEIPRTDSLPSLAGASRNVQDKEEDTWSSVHSARPGSSNASWRLDASLEYSSSSAASSGANAWQLQDSQQHRESFESSGSQRDSADSMQGSCNADRPTENVSTTGRTGFWSQPERRRSVKYTDDSQYLCSDDINQRPSQPRPPPEHTLSTRGSSMAVCDASYGCPSLEVALDSDSGYRPPQAAVAEAGEYELKGYNPDLTGLKCPASVPPLPPVLDQGVSSLTTCKADAKLESFVWSSAKEDRKSDERSGQKSLPQGNPRLVPYTSPNDRR